MVPRLVEVAAVAHASQQFVAPFVDQCFWDQHQEEAVVAARAAQRVVAPSGDP